MKGLALSWRDGSILGAAAFACLFTWLLPAAKPTAVLGRLDFGQFVFALIATALFLCLGVVLLTSPTRRRLTCFRAVAIFLSTVTAVLAWEMVASLWPSHPVMDNPWYLFSGQGLEESAVLPFERPAHLHWEGLSRGDLAILNDDDDPYAARVTFVTDHEGFHNSQDRTQADLIFVGDSFTEAGNLPEGDNFAQRTATALGQSVRNLGRAGYTGPSELIVLQKYGLKCRPRTVIWQFAESNDLDEAVIFAQWLNAGRPDYLEFMGWPGANHPESGRQFSPTWRLFCWLREPRLWPIRGQFQDRDGRDYEIRFLDLPSRKHSPVDHFGWPILAESLRVGAKLLQDEKIKLIVLLVPMKARALGPSVRLEAELQAAVGPDWDLPESMLLATHLRKLCEELNVPFLDATPNLRSAAAAGDLVYQPLDTHLSSEGHRVVSEALIEMLKTMRK